MSDIRTSELISLLQEEVRRHGDMPVFVARNDKFARVIVVRSDTFGYQGKIEIVIDRPEYLDFV